MDAFLSRHLGWRLLTGSSSDDGSLAGAARHEYPLGRTCRGKTMTDAKSASGHRGRFWVAARWGIAALILLLPLTAMQFTDEVAWESLPQG
jgi:hypothetical protein